MNITAYVEDKRTSEFYPTPDSLIKRMYDKIKWDYVQTVLEPSAGKGDIVKYLNTHGKTIYNNNVKFDIDCCELDNNLRQIILYTFGDQNKERLRVERQKISKKYEYIDNRQRSYYYYNHTTKAYEELPSDDLKALRDIDKQQKENGEGNVHIVHDDFLTYTPYKEYDVVIMNPPFSNGDRHLLKALELQQYGGQIVCLLNAETIRNPYTESRKHLMKLLDQYDADIEYISDAFSDAERTADVDIALIYVNIPKSQDDDSIFDKLSQSEKYHEPTAEEVTALDFVDYLGSVINRYNIEIRSGIELIKQYERMKPYLLNSFNTKDYPSPIMQLTDRMGKDKMTVNKYVREVRLKYWRALFTNPQFVGKMTSALQSKYRTKVESFADYDFSKFNIENLFADINTQIKTGVEDETEKMFDRLTSYSMYDGTDNRHLYDGWYTNEAYKIGKKVILPARGVFSEWSSNPRACDAYNTLADIERVLNFFDGDMTAEVDMQGTLEKYFEQGITKKIPLKYFEATFYLKGTVHLVFNCPELLDRYNIYIGKQRKWLPPTYGRKTYKDMTAEEKAVIDSFQGEKEYNKVMANKAYYLGGITHQTMNMIGMNS